MIKCTLVLISCMAATLITYAQDIPQKTNAVKVVGVSFEQVVNSMLDSGYIMKSIDKDFKTLKTEPRDACKTCAPKVVFDVRVKDSIAYFTGKWYNGGMEFDIEYFKRSPAHKVTFNAMLVAASALAKPVEYYIR